MALIKLDEKEKELIRKSIDKRNEMCDSNPGLYEKHLDELHKISERLNQYFVDLTPYQKAIIIGCIKNIVDFDNNNNLRLSDFEVLKIRSSEKEELIESDLALLLLKKLNDKETSKIRTFNSVLEKIELLLKSDKIYYSFINDGKIYKAAIMISERKGLRIEMEGALLENFNFETIMSDSYMIFDKPMIVVEKILKYSKYNELTENHKRLLEIIKCANA